MSDLTIRVRGGDEARLLARLLSERAPDLKCPVCGHRDFALLETPEEGLRTVLKRESTDGRFPQRIALQQLATVVCTNCGHLEQFAEAVLNGATPNEYGEEVSSG